eukprot:2005236-Prymnesium_polylepis.1
MLETARPALPDGVTLAAHKRAAKRRCQEALGFAIDEGATILSFVGRWAYEKGIDLIADSVPWLLDEFPNVSLIPPCCDSSRGLKVALAAQLPDVGPPRSLPVWSQVQIYVCGPIGDAAGMYAASKLVSLASIPALKPRLFVKAEFFRVTEDMRFAADYTICPSRTEPFGYVDVEFAWHGCLTIAPLVGGLGKVPGVYFRILDHTECAPPPPPRRGP